MDEVKKKVYLEIFASPETLLPVAGGITALMLSWAVGGNNAMNFAGLAGILGGAGMMATRLILGLERITQQAYDHVVRRQRRQQEESLERLHQRLLTDQDPRTQKCLTDLRQLVARLKVKVDNDNVNSAAFSVIEGVDQLFNSCVAQLEHSVDLWETARTMQGSSREAMLHQRDELVREICETVDHLAQSVEKFHAVTTHKNRSELARLRRELDQSMQVAREVERRTDELTQQRSYNAEEFE